VTLHMQVVICGLDSLAFRVLEQLTELGATVVAVAQGPSARFAVPAQHLGARIVDGDPRDADTLSQADVAKSQAILILTPDDAANLHTALAAQELNPGIKVVLRLFSDELRESVQSLFKDCTVLSSSAIAAPHFVSAGLAVSLGQRFSAGGRMLEVTEAAAGDPGVLLPLASRRGRDYSGLFPEVGENLLCVVDADQSSNSRRPSLIRRLRRRPGWRQFEALLTFVDRRLAILASVILALILLVSALYHGALRLPWGESIYAAASTLLTGSAGAVLQAPVYLRITALFVFLCGAASLATLYALIADAVLTARLSRALGVTRGRMRDHIIVCGLGSVGYRVVAELQGSGAEVAAVELQEGSRFESAARRLGVPVLNADARVTETLRSLGVERASCLMALTDDDMANLETALNARALKPGLRIVIRLFEPDFAERVEHAFGIAISRSVSALAAPVFVAAAMGWRIVTTVPVGKQVLVLAEPEVEEGAAMTGSTVGDLEKQGDLRVLALARSGDYRWRPAHDEKLRDRDRLLLVAALSGLWRVVQLASAGSPRAAVN